MVTHRRLPRICLLALTAFLVACGLENPLALPTETPLPVPPTETATAPAPADEIAAFWEMLGQAEARLPSARQEAVDRYVAGLSDAPLTAGNAVIFLWRGAAARVSLLGDMNNWQPEEALDLQRLVGSDLWYLAASFETEARLDYLFWVDGEKMALDPLNPRQINTPTGPRSVLAMPAYKAPPELSPGPTPAPEGEMSSHTLQSQSLGQTRTFFVYRPAGQLVGRKLPTVYINNGSDFINLIDAPALLDRLIAARQIPPLVAVFILPIEAGSDYRFNEDYIQFLADELAPFVQNLYGTDLAPEQTGTLGVGLGGLAAVNTALKRPDVFGRAAGLSGFYALDGGLTSTGGTGLPVVYLGVGSYETAVAVAERRVDVVFASERLAVLLEANGHQVLLEQRPEGHSWGLWQALLGRALAYLFD